MVFDFERMDVYRAALGIIHRAVMIADALPRGHRHLSDQLKRASSSIGLNIAEGVGEFRPLEKARFYRMALRSASETFSIVQISSRLRLVGDKEYEVFYEHLTAV